MRETTFLVKKIGVFGKELSYNLDTLIFSLVVFGIVFFLCLWLRKKIEFFPNRRQIALELLFGWFDDTLKESLGEQTVLRLMLNIQHRLNPLHVHCRLVEKGFSREFSVGFCRWYGMLIYSWLVRLTIMAVCIVRYFKQEAHRTDTQSPTG